MAPFSMSSQTGSCLDVSASTLTSLEASDAIPGHQRAAPGLRLRISQKCLKRMAKKNLKKLTEWLLEVEMGFVWGVAGLAIIIFVFAAIWYIDPALLTLVLRFRQARCTTINEAFLIGISNCSWTSCRLGCTREIYRCWQIQVRYERGRRPSELSKLEMHSLGINLAVNGQFWRAKLCKSFLKGTNYLGLLLTQFYCKVYLKV